MGGRSRELYSGIAVITVDAVFFLPNHPTGFWLSSLHLLMCWNNGPHHLLHLLASQICFEKQHFKASQRLGINLKLLRVQGTQLITVVRGNLVLTFGFNEFLRSFLNVNIIFKRTIDLGPIYIDQYILLCIILIKITSSGWNTLRYFDLN